MTIKQHGGVFGRNPTFHSVETDGGDVLLKNSTGTSPLLWDADEAALLIGPQSGAAKNGNTGLRVQNGNASYIEIVSTTTTATGVLMGDTDDSFRGGIIYDNNVDELRLWAGNASRVVVNSTGNLVMNSGAGIDFSATAGTGTSELFADYEEGTWTPTYVPQTNSFTSITYDPNTAGKYTKVGNTVYIAGSLRTDAITVGTATGRVSIGGLPFSVGSSNYASGGITVYQSNLFTGEEPSSADFVASGTTAILLYRTTADGPLSSESDVADLGTAANNNILRFFGFYFV